MSMRAWTAGETRLTGGEALLGRDDGGYSRQRRVRGRLEGAGNARILVKGRRNLLPAPPLPLNHATSVVVHLVRDNGPICWETTFFPTAMKNDGAQFKAKFP
jgi:hypothetical protein